LGLKGAVKLANEYSNTPLLLNHWGSVDAPDFAPFNEDPAMLYKLVTNPKRIHALAPDLKYQDIKIRVTRNNEGNI
jgi:hypothetical protein